MPLWWDLTSLKLFAASLSSGSIAPWRPRGSLYSGREEEMAGKSLPDFLPSRLTTWVSEDGSRVSIAGTLALHQCGLGSIPSSGPYVGWVCWFSYLLWAVSPRLLRFCPGYSGFPQATPVFPSRQTLTLHDLAWFVVPLTKKMPKPWDVNISCYYSVLKLKGGVEDIREKKKKKRERAWLNKFLNLAGKRFVLRKRWFLAKLEYWYYHWYLLFLVRLWQWTHAIARCKNSFELWNKSRVYTNKNVRGR